MLSLVDRFVEKYPDCHLKVAVWVKIHDSQRSHWAPVRPTPRPNLSFTQSPHHQLLAQQHAPNDLIEESSGEQRHILTHLFPYTPSTSAVSLGECLSVLVSMPSTQRPVLPSMRRCSGSPQCSSASLTAREVLAERRRMMYVVVWVELSIKAKCQCEGGSRCEL
jgi:hypothetical protein